MKFVDLYPIDVRLQLGTVHFSAESIISYAEKFDPQPFHLSGDTAKNSVFEGLCASGWQTSASWMKCFLAYWAKEVTRLTSEGAVPPKLGPSPGFRNLKWLHPVYAGDDVTYFATMLASRPLASRPGLRMNTTFNEGINQHGKPVVTFESNVLEFD
ncbi:MaoC/PaaZ C-terminal domain-containing protein [Rhizobium skierniewicense]|uniref:MaoC/PaaZ C-terminal domain-containing protein n=1 Tax=Rhizobium skierniewicense TaxID=984260 RepID=UPI00157453C0|nr:MaoC/PaaZ C-terminal domain-containing protein [Rhizobium skierniewicense]NTF32569.1 dehydratase [Rhizobium skierniewicense]